MKQIQSTDELSSVIANSRPSVLLFSADWCSDCRFLDLFIDEVVEQYAAKCDFYKVDRDDQSDVCEKFDVMGIPSFIVFQENEVLGRFVNGQRKTRPEVESFLNETLAQAQVR